MRSIAILTLMSVIALSTSAPAQTTSSSQATVTGGPASAALLSDLDQLQAAASQANTDIARMHIDKWKTDGGTKQQAQANASSLQRNLTTALPGLISDLRSAPQDLAAGFKLYRNLNALYDVLVSFTESAGAFGPKNDYDALAQQLDTIDSTRRVLGDRLESLAAQNQAELNQLRVQVHALQQVAVPPPPPKKVIVDNSEPVKKPAHKKKPATSSSAQPDSGATPATPAKSQ